MKITPVNKIQTGEKAALDIFACDGKKLLLKGSEFTGPVIGKLKMMKIPHAYTEADGFWVNTVFDTDLLAELIRVAWNYSESGGRNAAVLKAYNTDEIKMFAAYNSEPAAKMAYGHIFMYFSGRMAEIVQNTGRTCYDFMDYRNSDNYIYYHAVNSACISLLVGGRMGLKKKELADLCAGSLLFDLKMKTYGFASEKRPLDEGEKEELRQHVFLSYEEARNTYGLPSAAAGVVGQHHERMDGSGYPKKLKGEAISLAGRIAAIADVYDALLSKRPHRPPYYPDEAWEYIISNKGGLFDAGAADAFAGVVAKYYPGDSVILSDKRQAVVLRNNPGNPDRPVIKIIEKTGKSDIISDAATDLLEENTLSVVKTVKSARREE